MNPELIKQAYAYGAAVALQELGYNPQQAEAGGIKLAEEMEGMEDGGMGGEEMMPQKRPSAALPMLFGELGAMGAAPEGKKLRAMEGTSRGGAAGAGWGALGGATGGATLGALASLLAGKKLIPGAAGAVGQLARRVPMGAAAGIGGGLGLLGGGVTGNLIGRNKGFRAGIAED